MTCVLIEDVNDLGLLFHDASEGMSWASQTAALLAAAALLAQAMMPDWRRLITRLDSVGLSVACLPLLGYIFNSEALWGNVVYTKLALHTGIAFFLLFTGRLMMRADETWIGVLYAQERGSQMGRRILPVVILGPIVMCYLALIATQQRFVTADFRLTCLAFAVVALGTFAVVTVADRVNRLERSARAYEEELKERDLELVRSQKVAVLGRLVGGVSHDFNNLLSVIIGNLELFEHDESPENRDHYKDQALKAASNAAALTRQLLTYGRKSRLEPEPFVLDLSVAETLQMFHRIVDPGVRVIEQFTVPGHQVFLDPSNFQQVLLNILINARDAMTTRGIIFVTTGLVTDVPPPRVATHDEGPLREGSYVTVEVRDTGSGMPPGVLERIFEPYFTTKGVGEGSGLGLPMAQGFCRQSNGDIRVDSAVGMGTTVTLYFPLAGTVDRAATPIARPKPHTPKGRARILVVDDEDAITEMMATQLTQDGYEVETAKDARAALDLFESSPRFDLVISDVIMPGDLQGHHLAGRVHALWPDARVLLMSGYESNRLREQFTFAGRIEFLQKPIDRKTLRRTIVDLLES
ncbi:ATP-binding protein [Pararhodobacter zhoushanensis]|uniref:histidine kinase n=1 Tax=Pararhodobacter zhoushanensis TaxID=2479545 RepID=A0ABT3GU48_9RHOB|nr:ATP-binding protein [Pararhodobacter zhoushanensis]MCW1931035.1 response regulator [Pararhodobacter zhoushanensis]